MEVPPSSTFRDLQSALRRLRIENVACQKFVPEDGFFEFLDEYKLPIRQFLRTVIPVANAEEVADVILTRARKVFGILLLSDHVDYISQFLRYDQMQRLDLDAGLPYQGSRLYQILGNSVAADDFYDTQWEFCVPKFICSIIPRELDPHTVMPYVKEAQIEIGRFSSVYKVTLHPSYQPVGFEDSNVFARKEYSAADARIYKNKVSILSKLQAIAHPNILIPIACYSYRDKHNIVSRFISGGTLRDYLKKAKNPSLSREKVFCMMAGLASAISAFHCLTTDDETQPTYRGKHRDVWSNNILVDNDRLILADFGLAIIDIITPDTPAQHTGRKGYYQAPESVDLQAPYLEHNTTPAADIFSLGCIFTDLLVYFAFGPDGIKQFREARKFIIPPLTYRVYHKSNHIHEAVNSWLKMVLEEDSGESTTRAVCLIKEMMQLDPNKRPIASEVTAIISDCAVKSFSDEIARCFNKIEHCPEAVTEKSRYSSWAFVQSPTIYMTSGGATAVFTQFTTIVELQSRVVKVLKSMEPTLDILNEIRPLNLKLLNMLPPYRRQLADENLTSALLKVFSGVIPDVNLPQLDLNYPQSTRKPQAYKLLVPTEPNIDPRVPEATEFTDSGYASSKGGLRQRVAIENAGSADGNLSALHTVDVTDKTDAASDPAFYPDDSSVYTSVSRIAPKTVDTYVSVLVEHLARSISSESIATRSIESLPRALPELLKSFALSIGHHAPSQMHRDVMVFIRRYRGYIATVLQEQLIGHGSREALQEDQDKMPLSELMNRWYAADDKPSELPDSGLVMTNYEDESSIMDDWNMENGDDDTRFALSEHHWDADIIKLPGIEAYTSLIESSAGYSSLLANIRREVLLSFPEENAMERIRKGVVKFLPTSPFVSRARNTESFEMSFFMDWNFLKFHMEQEYTAAAEDALESAITITGHSTNSQALTCREYILQTWPSIGGSILGLIKQLLFHDESCCGILADGSRIHLTCLTRETIRVTVQGPAYCIGEVGELLAWLGSALRSSTVLDGVVYRTPLVADIRSVEGGDNIFECNIQFSDRADDTASEVYDAQGICWHDLFRNPVVVNGYPILRRGEGIPGLELPLGMMAELSQTRYINSFNRKLLIKGFASMLAPTGVMDNVVTWHLLHNEDGSRISYLRSATLPVIPTTISQLEQCRHILGWCPDMRLCAGAPNASYPVKGSRLPQACAPSPFASVLLLMGKVVTVPSHISVGIKDRPVHVSRNCYVRKLKWLRGKFVILWDEDDKRGWLINGPSALLHLVRASLDHDQYDEFNILSASPLKAIQEAKEPYKTRSALQVLLNPQNLGLRIYSERGSDTTLRDQVEYFCDILEKIIDHQQQITTEARPNSSTSRAYLEGWDFADIIKERDPIHPRVSPLDACGKSWVDFTNSISAVTLFGRQFGEIIKPKQVCSRWTTLPKGMSYLAICQQDLDEIMEADGDPFATPVRLADKLSWFIPSSDSGACQCTADNTVHSDLAQVILPTSVCERLPSNNLNMYQKDGAVFFGFNSTYRWFWGDTGDPSAEPTSHTSSESSKRPSSPSVDSGIGESSVPWSPEESRGRSPFTTRSGLSVDNPTEPSPPKRVRTRSKRAQLTAQSYRVAIICALHIELMAVRALLDHPHEEVPIPDGDPNYYAFGCVGSHRVVTACLPDGEYGTVPATEVIAHMKRSFPRVEFCLLVGIGGGVPSTKHDIRLGDVVVSTPSGSNSGVIPYDIKKILVGGESQSNAYLPSPPRHLRCALSKIKSDPRLCENPLLDESLQRIARDVVTYQHPPFCSDRLFNASFAHPSGTSSDTCDHSCPVTEEVIRTPRLSHQPQIHYGAIASGNQLIKDGLQRDIYAALHDVLCFETEAAGIMHAVPALVIRGICDYADSHKNKRWQRYAAATAAAYAKFFLALEGDTVEQGFKIPKQD
ncbi:hypothetical protein BJY01DRAFT_244279 [Aspergillus pseudoustus]|uniref:Protein kinase domain-containing protein n=1 Tax=Aspergillus pseudoustus TaxID=1810923 RepID=A0ABR4KM02_9EURO